MWIYVKTGRLIGSKTGQNALSVITYREYTQFGTLAVGRW